jgi:surfeit locus 1 family protein
LRRSTILFLIFAAILAAACVRLGFWQLSRLDARRASNATIESRGTMPVAPVSAVAGDSTTLRFRRVIVSGVPDYEREILLTHRGNAGAPGLDIITPVRVAGLDSVVLVNRGWIYSPDGMTADVSRWRERDSTFVGYIDSFEPSMATDSVRGRAIRKMDYAAIARTLPYPVRGFYVVALGDSVRTTDSVAAGRMLRLRPPKLGEGNHLSYAFQWFGFATIALVGAGIVAARSMQRRPS